ncbi:hypothetical protein M2103_001979 [Ereboglobus sp. PH5-5]|uniref:putative Na+/H+ antiporter n=1 Tax=Ereboglobus sp. PH5-5 TaxID=2940529 RepID=UPI002406E985|nr:putative Na+/H+ antiporter [Ereboglobus sp. PH5-5]MDF9833746.1 hypothetical protein [Ereboglobus sp. PH5-5]
MQLPAVLASLASNAPVVDFPRSLSSYADSGAAENIGLIEALASRIQAEPFNLAATIIFLLAIIHTFLTPRFRHWAHEVEEAHRKKLEACKQRREHPDTFDGSPHKETDCDPDEVSFKGQVLHFFGEVEAVFGIWAAVLVATMTVSKGWGTVVHYLGHHVNFTEPVFVVAIMALAATRPILQLAERFLRMIAALGKNTVAAWWITILVMAPLLGSLITEPAAMTIAALLLARQFYALKPRIVFAYATIGLLFVNVSVGGTLTNFAAPPVLMVAGPWDWSIAHMFTNFGWRAVIGIVVATGFYYIVFRKQFAALQRARDNTSRAASAPREERVPLWITLVQIGFMAWMVAVSHYPPMIIGGFLFFLAFAQATAHHQGKFDLKSPMLVGFFIAGLVIHGGLQGWWIEPVLARLDAVPLFFSAITLGAFNDNAAITYLATLVPDLQDNLKYAIVAGAVTGGGLTVIANAPNPAGQSILARFFPDGVSPLGLCLGALIPTAVLSAAFLLL